MELHARIHRPRTRIGLARQPRIHARLVPALVRNHPSLRIIEREIFRSAQTMETTAAPQAGGRPDRVAEIGSSGADDHSDARINAAHANTATCTRDHALRPVMAQSPLDLLARKAPAVQAGPGRRPFG